MNDTKDQHELTIRKTTEVHREHFEVLDGLRGVAAYCVFLVHSFSRVWATNGFLGVDFFFMLSGFVIAHSYGQRLRSGTVTLKTFAARRFVRLYPMVFAGTLLGLFVAVMHNKLNPSHAYGPGSLATWTLLSGLLIPYLARNPLENAIFPLNTVLWSLFFEVLANAAYSIFTRHMKRAVLVTISLAALALTVSAGGLDGGTVITFWRGFPRVVFGFFAGVLMYELWLNNQLFKISLGLLPLALVLLGITFYPTQISGISFVPVAAIFCAVILVGANASVTGATRRVCIFLGRISYPMYLLHRPLLYIVVGIAKKTSPSAESHYVWLVVIAIAATTLISHWAVLYYENPARRFLQHFVTHKMPAKPMLLKPTCH